MSATPHNLSAIDAMGQQFKYNIFDKAPGKLLDVHKKNVIAAKRQAAMTAASRNAYAQSAQNVVNQGRKNFAQNQATMAKKAQQAQKAHAAAVKKGTAAPAPGAQPRVFAMPAGPQGVQQRTQQKTAAANQVKQVNNAHGEALKEAADRAKTMRSQVNFAHGEAHKENNRRTKEAQKGSAPTPTRQSSATVAPSSGVPNLPGGPMQRAGSSPAPRAAQGSQFVNVQARDNSPFPTHEHPEGSSNLKLGNLSAAQPKPHDFTVGSRNVKPGGIAAKGSQLEAWAISKSQAVQARQASRKAGGRDKELAAEAKKKENFANQPLSKFAP